MPVNKRVEQAAGIAWFAGTQDARTGPEVPHHAVPVWRLKTRSGVSIVGVSRASKGDSVFQECDYTANEQYLDG